MIKKVLENDLCRHCICRTFNDFLYVAGQMNVENLAGNQFVNFAMVAFTEFPSVFIGEFLINRIGRRWSHVGCMALTTLLFIIITPLATVKMPLDLLTD